MTGTRKVQSSVLVAHPLESGLRTSHPLWTAGAGSEDDAVSFCTEGGAQMPRE